LRGKVTAILTAANSLRRRVAQPDFSTELTIRRFLPIEQSCWLRVGLRSI
jgi:hypothetical protein